MRTLRLSLVGSVILALLGGVSATVLAQEDEEPAPAVKATITATRGTGGQDEGCADGPGNSPEICTGTWPSEQWSATDPRLNGTATTLMTSGTTEDLYEIWGRSSSDLYVVGDAGTILHYDGSSWSDVSGASTTNLRGVWYSSSNNVYAVGHFSTILQRCGDGI